MSFGFGAARGAVHEVLYTVLATLPFLLFGGIASVGVLLPRVALWGMVAGGVVGAAVVVIRAYWPGAVSRARLAMVLFFVLTGSPCLRWLPAAGVIDALERALLFAPELVPLALGAPWAMLQWSRARSAARPLEATRR